MRGSTRRLLVGRERQPCCSEERGKVSGGRFGEVCCSCEEGGTDIFTHDYTRGPRELRDKKKDGEEGGKHAFP